MRVSRADSAHVADATGQAISQILGSVPSQPTSPASTDRSSVPCYTLGKGWCALALLFHLLVPRAEVGDRCCEVLHSFSCHKLLLRLRAPCGFAAKSANGGGITGGGYANCRSSKIPTCIPRPLSPAASPRCPCLYALIPCL